MPDGTLWLTTTSGVARLQRGTMTFVKPSFKLGEPGALALGMDGNIWFTRNIFSGPKGPLCSVHPDETHVECYGAPILQSACQVVQSLAVDQKGDIWMGCTPGLVRYSSGSFTYQSSTGVTKDNFESMLGAILDVDKDRKLVGYSNKGKHFGLQELSAGRWQSYDIDGFKGEDHRITNLVMDSQNALWIGTQDSGLFHVVNGKIDHFGTEEGLSGNFVGAMVQDAEGSMWVTTSGGIDRFHKLKVALFTEKQGMVSDSAIAVAAEREGPISVGMQGGMNFISPGSVSTLSAKKDVLGNIVHAILEDHTGTLWIADDTHVGRLIHNRFHPIAQPTGVAMMLIEDPQHNIWIRINGKQYRVDGDHLTLDDPPMPIPAGHYNIYPDPLDGFWMLGSTGSVVRFEHGKYRLLAKPQDNIRTIGLVFTPDKQVWSWGRYGLQLWKDSRWVKLDADHGLPCTQIFHAIEDGSGSLWAFTSCGLVVIPDKELHTWTNDPGRMVHPSLLIDAFDGALFSTGDFVSTAALSSDGRLWFAHQTALQEVDTRHLPFNRVPPPVHIEQIIADHKLMHIGQDISLPARARDLEIDYTALSLVVPQKVRFRYRLSGVDKDWQDVGTRRQAFYMNLGPGHYAFQVIACNNDGVWNETGDSLHFTIPPTFYQTLLFRYLLIAVAAGLLWLLYLWRLHSVTVRIEERMAERLSERERIARELHDTLLQGFQALLLRIGIVAQRLPDEEPVRKGLEDALDRAEGVLLEGRSRIRVLRNNDDGAKDFGGQLSRLCAELADGESPRIRFSASGGPRRIDSVVSEELYSICKEALTNALRHSDATDIHLSMACENDFLKICCADNGRGMNAATLENTDGTDHWGIRGMKERAQQLGADLSIQSNVGAGTEIALRVPGKRAYALPRPSSVKHLFTSLLRGRTKPG